MGTISYFYLTLNYIYSRLNKYFIFIVKNILMNHQPKYNRKEKYVVLIVSFLAWAGCNGMLGVYGRIKQPMAEQHNLQGLFLGQLDSIMFVGRLFGQIYTVLVPTSTPKRSFLLHSILMSVFLSLVGILSLVGLYGPTLVIICLFLNGFSRAYILMPVLIVYDYFDAANKDRALINLWFSAGLLGDVMALFFSQLLLKTLQLNWAICLILNNIFFVIIAIALYYVAEQVQNQNKMTTFTAIKQTLVNYYSKQSNILHVIQFNLLTSFRDTFVIMWFPYYFIYIGFKDQVIWLCIVYPIFLILGIPVFELIIRKNFEKYIHYITMSIFLLLVVICFFLTQLGNQQGTFTKYLILLSLTAFLIGGPYGSTTSSEIRARASSPKQLYQVATSIRVFQQLYFCISAFLVGYFVQKDIDNFLFIMLISTIITAANNIYRSVKWQIPKQKLNNYQKMVENKQPMEREMIRLS